MYYCVVYIFPFNLFKQNLSQMYLQTNVKLVAYVVTDA